VKSIALSMPVRYGVAKKCMEFKHKKVEGYYQCRMASDDLQSFCTVDDRKWYQLRHRLVPISRVTYKSPDL
jgi:hypothetical protein